MAIKERRIKCVACGERETVIRGERGPVSAYCDLCREDRKRAYVWPPYAIANARQGDILSSSPSCHHRLGKEGRRAHTERTRCLDGDRRGRVVRYWSSQQIRVSPHSGCRPIQEDDHAPSTAHRPRS